MKSFMRVAGHHFDGQRCKNRAVAGDDAGIRDRRWRGDLGGNLLLGWALGWRLAWRFA
jgi:hypothetical protein